MMQFYLVICATVFLEASSCCVIMYLDCSIVSMSVSCLGGTEVDCNLNGFQMHPWFDIIHPLFCFISEK